MSAKRVSVIPRESSKVNSRKRICAIVEGVPSDIRSKICITPTVSYVKRICNALSKRNKRTGKVICESIFVEVCNITPMINSNPMLVCGVVIELRFAWWAITSTKKWFIKNTSNGNLNIWASIEVETNDRRMRAVVVELTQVCSVWIDVVILWIFCRNTNCKFWKYEPETGAVSSSGDVADPGVVRVRYPVGG